ncbi:hypothetical protein Isop_0493 [Isosphaera pallida ATCC 43644]|uniref:Uncharacterized protein n=1 Tax=Isosphaera pallida (strain ATCC 43644 / DSM 9630 / IS1B) TaxID=575540 RepID=E8QZG1_ISOPI|nr:hypothetical protein [Isosphaera pallida]ADV61088.1 hypothetical protein Isop_0493 [Isosphaera pallida ATCC 43644]
MPFGFVHARASRPVRRRRVARPALFDDLEERQLLNAAPVAPVNAAPREVRVFAPLATAANRRGLVPIRLNLNAHPRTTPARLNPTPRLNANLNLNPNVRLNNQLNDLVRQVRVTPALQTQINRLLDQLNTRLDGVDVPQANLDAVSRAAENALRSATRLPSLTSIRTLARDLDTAGADNQITQAEQDLLIASAENVLRSARVPQANIDALRNAVADLSEVTGVDRNDVPLFADTLRAIASEFLRANPLIRSLLGR